MSTKYVGNTGSVTIGSALAGIKSWSLDVSADTVETTSFDDAGVRAYLGTTTGFSGSFEGFKTGVPVVIDGAVAAFTLAETSTGTQVWTGNLILTGLHAASSHDGLVTYAYDFRGTGALTEPTA